MRMTLIDLNTWSLVGGIIWEGSGNVTLLEGFEVLNFQELMSSPVSALCFMIMSQAVRAQLLPQCHPCLPAAMLPAVMVTDSPPLTP